jgi:hypothetical protein
MIWWFNNILLSVNYVYWCLTPLSTIFRYIVGFCFIGGGYWSTKRKSKTSRSPWKILPYICLCRELYVTDANRTPEPYFLTNDSSTEGWIFTLAYAARTYRNDITNQLNYATTLVVIGTDCTGSPTTIRSRPPNCCWNNKIYYEVAKNIDAHR